MNEQDTKSVHQMCAEIEAEMRDNVRPKGYVSETRFRVVWRVRSVFTKPDASVWYVTLEERFDTQDEAREFAKTQRLKWLGVSIVEGLEHPHFDENAILEFLH